MRKSSKDDDLGFVQSDLAIYYGTTLTEARCFGAFLSGGDVAAAALLTNCVDMVFFFTAEIPK